MFYNEHFHHFLKYNMIYGFLCMIRLSGKPAG